MFGVISTPKVLPPPPSLVSRRVGVKAKAKAGRIPLRTWRHAPLVSTAAVPPDGSTKTGTHPHRCRAEV